jgi:lipopolysaccharide export LptBFGC system permease protein LptF
MERVVNDLLQNYISNYIGDPLLFFPSNKFNVETNSKAICKYLLYSALAISILTGNWKIVVVLIVALIILQIFTHTTIDAHNFLEDKKNAYKNKCRASTLDNPMGNLLIYNDPDDYENKLCEHQEKKIDDNLKYNIYYDSKDLFQKKNNTRPFITMPSQTHPNNIDAFKKYLYDFNAPTCKLDSYNCMYNNDIRYHKNSFLSS